MKAQSDTHPPDQIMSRGKTRVNYNVHEVEVEDPEGGTRTAYEYDYVEVEGKVTKAKFLAALEAEELEDDPEAWTPDEVAAEHANMMTAKADLRKAHVPPSSVPGLRDRVDLIETMIGIIPE